MAVIENNRSLWSVLASCKLTTHWERERERETIGGSLFVRRELSLSQSNVNIGFRATDYYAASLRSGCMQMHTGEREQASVPRAFFFFFLE